MNWPRRRVSPWRAFVINLSLLVFIATAGLFAGVSLLGQEAIDAEVAIRAQTVFDAIVLARKWNADHGGVWVVKGPDDVANPYLTDSEMTCTDGKVLVAKNPALMTREISAIAETQGSFRVHITSLKPKNPTNVPDAFEREALTAFEQGARAHATRERSAQGMLYRYMAPLWVERSCLSCHEDQGYREGDVRGGISVSFNIDAAEQAIIRNRWLAVLAFVCTGLALFLVLWRLISRLHHRLQEAESLIRELATTDELTALANRRAGQERLLEELVRAGRHERTLAVVLLDIDHFKQVNDTHGHDAGDVVLKAVAKAVQTLLRQTDMAARWGGEEFLVVLPETGLAGAKATAERIRQAIASLPVLYGGRALQITVSLGAAELVRNERVEQAADDLLKRADQALYRAKHRGRNRVEADTGP